MFEAFLGAIFLDFNKLSVKDEDGWFENVFLTGPGFQVVQLFLENVFEKHVGWIYLIQNDYNYIHILQIRIQKEALDSKASENQIADQEQTTLSPS